MTSLPMASDFHGHPKRRYRFDDPLYEAPMNPKFDDDEAQAARLVIAANATDVEDARLLLAMCGLLPEGAREPGARAARWDTGWTGK